MTAPETNTSAHVVPAVAAALASSGVAALTAMRLFTYTPLSLMDGLTSVGRHLPAVLLLAMTATVAVVTAVPSLRRGGGWLVPFAGLAAVVACFWIVTAGPEAAEASQIPLMAGYGMALGGVLAAAAFGGLAQRVAVAVGLAFGLAVGTAPIRLFTPEYSIGQNAALYVSIPVAVIAALVAIAAVLSPKLQAPELLAHQTERRELFMPTILAAVLYLAIVAGNQLRESIVEDLTLSQEGFSSPLRIEGMVTFAEYSAIGLALLVGLIFIWYGHRAGKAQVTRWILLCLALAGPILASVLIFQYERTDTQAAMVLVTAIGAAAGGLLARYARRDLPWEVIGIGLAAFGMIFGMIANRMGPNTGDFVTLLIAGGTAFALGSGLVALLDSVARPAAALSLGVATLALTAYAMRPATLLALQPRIFNDLHLSVPVVSLLAATGILATLHLSRRANRTPSQTHTQLQ